MAEKDFYKILGVQENATQDAIKREYKKLAIKYHPDKHLKNKAAAEAKFKEISEAYYVLGNKEKRAEYDTMRKYGSRGRGTGGKRYQGASQGFNYDDFLRQFSGGGRTRKTYSMGGDYSIFNDIFGDIFGMGGEGRSSTMFGQQYEPGQRVGGRTSEVQTDFEKCITLTKTQATQGGKIKLTLVNNETLMVKIPPHAKHGQKLKIPGRGSACPCCGKHGDLYLVLQITA